MKKEKFTPGPWVQLKNSDATDILIGGEKEYVCRVNSHISKNNDNAALIAAAPDLYEALKAAITEIESFTDFKISGPDSENEVLNGLYSALAKARGENVE